MLNPKTDLRARSYSFSLMIIEFVNTLPNKRSAWIIADQLLRSGTSIGANIAEAKGSSSRLEFKKFYQIALKSANESRYWLDLIKDSKLSQEDGVIKIINELNEISKMLGSSIITLKNSKF